MCRGITSGGGFIKERQGIEDIIHAIPDRKLQINKGWPKDSNNIELNNARLDENGNLCIDIFQQGGNLFKHDTSEEEATLSSGNLNGNNWLAIPFVVNKETRHLRVSMVLKRDGVARVRAVVYGADNAGLPDISRELGIYSADSFSDLIATFRKAHLTVPLGENLLPGKQYFVVIYPHMGGNHINAGYKSTPGETNYYYTTDGGTTWTPYEYTPFLEVNGLVDEGSVTLSQFALSSFKNHLSLGVDILESTNSFYEIYLLDMEDNIIRQNVQVGEQLLDIDHKDIKIRLKLIRAGVEEPKLANYHYTWIEDISQSQALQTMVPSNQVIFEFNDEVILDTEAEMEVLKLTLSNPGRYRIKGEFMRTFTSSGERYATVEVYLKEFEGDRIIGKAMTNSSVYVPFSIDLGSVFPATEIFIRYRIGSTSGTKGFFKYIQLCGAAGTISYRFERIE